MACPFDFRETPLYDIDEFNSFYEIFGRIQPQPSIGLFKVNKKPNSGAELNGLLFLMT